METIASGIIVLCMFYQGGIIEHTYIQDQKMSSCLKAKRTVERSVNPKMYVCNVEKLKQLLRKMNIAIK